MLCHWVDSTIEVAVFAGRRSRIYTRRMYVLDYNLITTSAELANIIARCGAPSACFTNRKKASPRKNRATICINSALLGKNYLCREDPFPQQISGSSQASLSHGLYITMDRGLFDGNATGPLMTVDDFLRGLGKSPLKRVQAEKILKPVSPAVLQKMRGFSHASPHQAFSSSSEQGVQQEKRHLLSRPQKVLSQRQPFFHVDEEEPGVLMINPHRHAVDSTERDGHPQRQEPIPNLGSTEEISTQPNILRKRRKSKKDPRISPKSPVPSTSNTGTPARKKRRLALNELIMVPNEWNDNELVNVQTSLIDQLIPIPWFDSQDTG